jgi:hypothetical protein
MAQQTDWTPPGYGFGAGGTQHTRLLTGKATGKAGQVWIIVLLCLLGMRQQHQTVLVCRIAEGKAANFELDRGLIGKGGDRFGIRIGMLVRGVQLLEQAGNSLPKRGQLLFLYPEGSGIVTPDDAYAKGAFPRGTNGFSINSINGCKIVSGI